MRATLRITWLLLSLNFLFHCIYSDDYNSTSSLATTTGNVSVTTNPTQASSIGTTAAISTNTPPKTTQTGITVSGDAKSTTGGPTQPSAAPNKATTASHPSASASSIATEPRKAQSTVSITLASTSGGSVHPPTAASNTTPKSMIPTSGSNNDSAQSHTTVTKQAPNPSDATVTTKNSIVAPGNPDVGTVTSTPSRPGATITSVIPPASTLSNQVTKPGTVTELTSTAKPSAASEPTKPAVLPGVTSHSTNPPKAGATEPVLVTKAGTPAPPTTTTPTTTTPTTTTTTTTITTTTTTSTAPLKTFTYSLLIEPKTKEEKALVQVCKRLIADLKNGTCLLTYTQHGDRVVFHAAELQGKVNTSVVARYYEEITKTTDNKTLITILASCGALLIMIVILGVCVSHHRRPYSENQQHLTEELHTVENGYHDNPTLEVMEVQPEMQEKKMALNGEFNDSWIVPIDNLMKEDIPDEEDTHL
ncbi:podocalyxin [Cololabis saira]|uniref:podocalyxin n=1 Tax=Cololabis saira TaxID=129043 RepID=UPI002AD22592|nr:podocalyxin [Cololabis saira]